MRRYYITHRSEHGERSQLSGAWEAETPEQAVAQMLKDSGGDDDGNWEAHEVTSEDDIIQ